MSRTALRTPARVFSQSAPPIFESFGVLAAGVLADEADVLGVDVDAVAALELDDEAVARDAEHLARLHAEVAADAVHAVHDEVARGETFVVVDARARATRPAVHAPATGEVGLGDERELHARAARRRDRAARPRRDAGRAQHRARSSIAIAVDGDALVGEHLLDAVGRPLPSAATNTWNPSARSALSRRPSASASPTTGSNALAASTGVSGLSGAASTGTVCALVCASRRSNGSDSRGVGVGIDVRAPGRRRASARARPPRRATPGARSRRRRGSNERDERARGQQVGQQVLVGGQPRQPRLHAVEGLAFREPLPLLATPRLRLQQLGARARAPRRSAAARAPGRTAPRRPSTVERWSATENCDSRSTSSPHRSMRTGWSAVDGYTSTIEPRTATSPRASTWYSRR